MTGTTPWQEKINGWYQKPPDDVETYGRHAAPLSYVNDSSVAIVDPYGYYDSTPKKHRSDK